MTPATSIPRMRHPVSDLYPQTPAFTLIELLVVVTIIAVLLALLTPALDQAVDQAERAVCGGNLHTWGQGHSQYFFDNRRHILSAPNFRRGISQGVLPNHCRWRKTTAEEAGDFNLDDIAPYVQGPNTGTWNGGSADHVGTVWFCPAARSPYWYRNNADISAQTTDPNSPLTDRLGAFMYNDYAYFGLIGRKYRQYATEPDLLSERSMGEGRILMTDTIFHYPTAPTSWWFNHSPVGYSMHEPSMGRCYQGSAPPLGVNRLTADGGVAWHDDDHTQMDPPQRDHNAWVSDRLTNGQAEPGGFVNFY